MTSEDDQNEPRDFLSEREFPDESDMDSADEVGTIDCPNCGQEIAEESPWCPKCGNYISQEDAPISKPGWIVIGTIVAILIVVIFWIAFGR